MCTDKKLLLDSFGIRILTGKEVDYMEHLKPNEVGCYNCTRWRTGSKRCDCCVKFSEFKNIDTLNADLSGLEIAEWNEPNGGYFISLDVTGGSASRVGVLCKEAGVTLTNVGATFPYGKDPSDNNIRIAPTFPDADTLKQAVKVLTVSVKLACLENLMK